MSHHLLTPSTIRLAAALVLPALLAACLATPTASPAPTQAPRTTVAAIPTPAAAATPGPASAAAPAGLSVPDGRAVVVFYRDPADTGLRPSMRLRWNTPTRRNQTAYHYAVTDPRLNAPRTDIRLDMREHPTFITVLMPGPYAVRYQALTHRGLGTLWDGKLAQERSDTAWTLAPGELRYVQLRMDGTLAMSDTPPPHLSGTAWEQVRRFNWDAGLMGIARRHYLGARALDVAFDQGCPTGPGRIVWANAQFEGEFSGCNRLDGTLSYEAGPQVRGQVVVANPTTLWGTLSTVDGDRLSGPLQLAPANDQGVLPVPVLAGLGQVIGADGSGFLGPFQDGQPQGTGYCFTRDGGGLCAYAQGQRLFGPSARTPSDILGEFRGVAQPTAVDMLRQRWIDALMGERWDEFLTRLTDLQALGVDPGVESLFFEARAWEAIGHPELARERTAAYLNLAGPTGASYTQALSLFPQVQDAADAQRATRLDFCQAALQRGASPCGCQEFAQELPQLGTAGCS